VFTPSFKQIGRLFFHIFSVRLQPWKIEKIQKKIYDGKQIFWLALKNTHGGEKITNLSQLVGKL
jgi:hypothetical protein